MNLSKNSALKMNIKKITNNTYEYKYSYLENVSEINTTNMIQWVINNYNGLNKESPLKTFKQIDDLQLETYNFFINKSSTLISRIWSLLINLTEKKNLMKIMP